MERVQISPKVSIAPEGQPQIDAMFNPNQYSVSKSNSIAEAAIPGLEAPILLRQESYQTDQCSERHS